jgi:tetratricopeptide (TPR) repeat protein
MGNELANEFYKKGDFRSALAIYQSLAKYSEAPEWRWPAVHQIGLCFEHLGLPERAIMAYQEILEPNGAPADETLLSDRMKSLHEMAKWRLEHLQWEDDLVARLNILRTQ